MTIASTCQAAYTIQPNPGQFGKAAQLVDSMAIHPGFQIMNIPSPSCKDVVESIFNFFFERAFSAYCSDYVVFECPHPKVVGGSSITISSGNRPFLSEATPPAKMKIDTQLSPYSMCISTLSRNHNSCKVGFSQLPNLIFQIHVWLRTFTEGDSRGYP